MELQKFTAELPAIIGMSKAAAEGIAKDCDGPITKCEGVDLKALNNEQIKRTDAVLNNLQVRCSDSSKSIEEARKPFTQAFEDFKRENFIKNEKTIQGYKDRVVAIRSRIAAEIIRRQDESERDKNKDLNRKQEITDALAAFTLHISVNALQIVASTKESMWKKFYATDDLKLFEKNLREWTPSAVLTDETIAAWAKAFRFNWVYGEAVALTPDSSGVRQTMDDQLLPEKMKIIESIPARLEQLSQTIDKEQLAAADALVLSAVKEDAAEALCDSVDIIEQQVSASAQAEKLNTSFEVMANAAADAPQMASGTKVNKVYAPTTHGHWAALIAWYVSHEAPHMAVDELAKKFSFVLTKANNIMNATEEKIVGIPTENDFSVRGTKKRKDG